MSFLPTGLPFKRRPNLLRACPWALMGLLFAQASASASEILHHLSGHQYSIPGKVLPAGAVRPDYFPSGQNTWLTPGDTAPQGDLRQPLSPIRGGFASVPDFATAIGFNLERLSAQQFGARLDRFRTRLLPLLSGSPALLTACYRAYGDQAMLPYLESFFNDGGRIQEVEFGGRYTPSPILILANLVGASTSPPSGPLPLAVRSRTLFHELLHYVFDKVDSLHSEVTAPGGKDHEYIYALEERFVLTSILQDRQSPLVSTARPLDGFLTFGKVGEKIQRWIASGDLASLESYTRLQDGAYTEYVQSAMLSPASSREAGLRTYAAHPSWIITEDQLQDLAFLHAINASLVVGAVRVALPLVAGPDHPVPWTQVWSDPRYVARMERLTGEFRTRLQRPSPLNSPWAALLESLRNL